MSTTPVPLPGVVHAISGAPVRFKDMNADRRGYYYFPVPWLSQTLAADERDIPGVHMLLNTTLVLAPLAGLVAWTQSHWVGAMYTLVAYLGFMPRYMSWVHEHSHRPLSGHAKTIRRRLFDLICVDLTGLLLLGLPIDSYRMQHCIIHHHAENHQGLEPMSTEQYDRACWKSLVRLWFHHYTPWGIIIDVVSYGLRTPRHLHSALRYALLACGWFGVVAMRLLCHFSAPALWVLAVPILLTGIGAAVGGMSYHLFIHPSDPTCHSVEVINCVANTGHPNQGFHATHHKDGTLHWSALPAAFVDNLPLWRKREVLIFQEVDNPMLLWYALTGDYDALASHLVYYKPLSLEAATHLIKQYLKPVVHHSHSGGGL